MKPMISNSSSLITRAALMWLLISLIAHAEPLDLRFEKDTARVALEHAQIDRLMEAAKLHTLIATPEFLAFMKTYRRNADVVETSQLGFLSDSSESAKEFMDTALKKDSWKKPMDTPLSFIFILKCRTARDWFRIDYFRLHDRSLDLEVDQLCPSGAPELKEPAFAVIEIPLGPLAPGSFHYSTHINPGTYKRALSDHPEGWEYSDVSGLQSSGSGCTIVDPKTNNVPGGERPPIRKTEFLSDAQLDQALEQLRYAKFPTARSRVYELIGLSKEQQERPSNFGFSDGVSFVIHQLTDKPNAHLLELRGQKGDSGLKGDIESARIYYQEADRTYTLYDSRVRAD